MTWRPSTEAAAVCSSHSPAGTLSTSSTMPTWGGVGRARGRQQLAASALVPERRGARGSGSGGMHPLAAACGPHRGDGVDPGLQGGRGSWRRVSKQHGGVADSRARRRPCTRAAGHRSTGAILTCAAASSLTASGTAARQPSLTTIYCCHVPEPAAEGPVQSAWCERAHAGGRRRGGGGAGCRHITQCVRAASNLHRTMHSGPSPLTVDAVKGGPHHALPHRKLGGARPVLLHHTHACRRAQAWNASFRQNRKAGRRARRQASRHTCMRPDGLG